MEEHWTEGFEHDSITDENRESFNTAMAKFPTQADAVVNNLELQKLIGKPFKMPESLDKLPDDASRVDFTAQAHKLLGISKTKDIATLADVNLKDGLPEGSPYDEDFANSFKQFVVDNDLNVNSMPKLAKFFNEAMATITAKAETDKIAAAKSCDESLIAHPDIGSEEKLLEMTELFKRAIRDRVGLTPEEFEEFGDSIALTMLTTNPVAARVMLKQFAPLAAEAGTEEAGGGTKVEAKKDPDEGSKSYVALGWSEEEKQKSTP